MSRLKAVLVWTCVVSVASGQQAPTFVERPHVPIVIRPYKAPAVAPIRLNNSNRLHGLIRAGRLYLTVQDAIAAAIENNLDLEVARYGPVLAEWAVERQSGGGALRGAGGNSSQVGSVASGQGVSGSLASAGLGNGGGGGNIGGGGNSVVQQIGPVAPVYDPTLQNSTTFSHLTTPFANLSVAGINPVIDTIHNYTTRLQQGLVTGGTYYIQQNESYLKENAPGNILNPSEAPRLYLYVQHYLAQGAGIGLNTRFIRIAKKNEIAAQETFRSQLLDMVSNVLNLYWNVVSATDEQRARERAVELAQKFYQDTKDEIQTGVLARVELPRAEVEVESRRQDLQIAQSNLQQQEALLKEALLRSPDTEVEAAAIVPLDRIEVPTTDDLAPLRQLLATAMAKRPDVAVSKIRDETALINTLGTTNSLLPTAIAYGTEWGAGVTGDPHQFGRTGPNPYFVGGLGNAFGQALRRDFPNERGGVQMSIPVKNRVAQADYGIDQLQLRQNDLTGQRTNNQIVVDISRQTIALRQARSRYSQAVNTRQLQEELLKAEQTKFSFGASSISAVIVVQRALVAAQTSEIQASAAYARARTSLDQALGQTLEVNHVSVEEGLRGHVSRESTPPVAAP
jgi:outer membrane protein TolC